MSAAHSIGTLKLSPDRLRRVLSALMTAVLISSAIAPLHAQEVAGVTVTPHIISPVMRWRRPPTPELGARVELVLRNASDAPLTIRRDQNWTFDGSTPAQLLESQDWAWHETPAVWAEESVQLPPQALTVLHFNGRSDKWGVGTDHTFQPGPDGQPIPFQLAKPQVWLQDVTFLAVNDSGELLNSALTANQIIVHLRRDDTSGGPLQVTALNIWLPSAAATQRIFTLAQSLPSAQLKMFGGTAELGQAGGFSAAVQPLPRRNCLVEVQLQATNGAMQSLWGSLKIRPESFDISGGWIQGDVNGRSALTIDQYRRTLARMHINAGQIEEVAGYTDDAQVYQATPFKRFNRLGDLARYDRDELLPTIHAVEFIGEPQYGGGRPVPPQEVHSLLAPYRDSRLHTSVTLSEERTWRYYAGLSDHPHYDAYRVIAPAADAWSRYDRWNGKSIRWGAPLETVGEMTRSLRELNRPRAIAYWSQGAHDGWGGFLSPRRGSPTADELRAQAWHALSARITSLYWFNLSLKSLLRFHDLIQPITEVNSEIRLLDELLLRSTALHHQAMPAGDQPDWEICVLGAPEAAIFVVHDVGYGIDEKTNTFRFQKRQGAWNFPRPAWLPSGAELFRVDASGTHDAHGTVGEQVHIQDEVHVVGIYVATASPGLRQALQARLHTLLAREAELGIDPGSNEQDLEKLKEAAK
ncbi:MAG: hypothetical protein ACK5YC_05005 [Planctomyces sp.]